MALQLDEETKQRHKTVEQSNASCDEKHAAEIDNDSDSIVLINSHDFTTVRSILKNKDKSGQISRHICKQLVESEITIKEILSYDEDDLIAIITEIIGTIPDTMCKLPTAIKNSLIKGLNALKNKTMDKTDSAEKQKIEKSSASVEIEKNNNAKINSQTSTLRNDANASEIRHFLQMNNLSYLENKLTQTDLNMSNLLTIVNTDDFDQLCNKLNMSLNDKIKLKTSLNDSGIKVKMDLITDRNYQLTKDLELESKTDAITKNSTQSEVSGNGGNSGNSGNNVVKKSVIPVKVCLMGAGYVGKTSIIERFVNDKFSETLNTTIGYAYNYKNIQLDEKQTIKFGLWDTSGQEMYYSTTIRYYRDADVVIIVYDGSNEESFKIGKQRLNDVLEYKFEFARDKVIAFVANKCDLKEILIEQNRQLQLEQWELRKEEMETIEGIDIYLETSAKRDLNIDKLFNTIILRLDVNKLDKFNKMVNDRDALVVDGKRKTVGSIVGQVNGGTGQNANSVTLKQRCCDG